MEIGMMLGVARISWRRKPTERGVLYVVEHIQAHSSGTCDLIEESHLLYQPVIDCLSQGDIDKNRCFKK
jgi:hypothetical protein